MLSALSDAGAEFLVVGAHAVAFHGQPRATGDLDLWIRPTTNNAKRVRTALETFGAPLFNLTIEDLRTPELVFQIGVVPCRIDILTSITGVEFGPAWSRRVETDIEGVRVCVLGRQDLLRNKQATGRVKDLLDLELLAAGDEDG